MKLVLQNTEDFRNERFKVLCKEEPCLDASWHYHPQYELFYEAKSSGIRFVGDSVSHFSPGELVLVGPYLPHLWRNDYSAYRQENPAEVFTVVIKFTENFIGEGTFDNPAFFSIKQLLELSKYGVSFRKKVSTAMHQDILGILELSPAEQLTKLLLILHRLSMTNDKQVLSSSDMRQYTSYDTFDRLDTVLKFISDNYMKPISLQDVADIACMTTNSFCRFFKRMTNKSYTQFLNEIRIRNASRLLMQKELRMYEVGYMVGYQSMTNFYRQFKHITGSTPKTFRRTI